MQNYDIGRGSAFGTATNVSLYTHYQQGFRHLSPVMDIKFGKTDQLIDLLKANKWVISDQSEFSGVVIAYFKDEAFISINKPNNLFFIQSTNYKVCEDWVRIFEDCIEKLPVSSDDDIDITYYYLGPHGLTTQDITINKKNIEPIRPQLYPDINIDKLYEDYLNAKESILFLVGEPGVGKTTFLRYVLQKAAAKGSPLTWDGERRSDFMNRPSNGGIAYIKDTGVLMQSQFWSGITNQRYDIIILDDLDFALTVRESKDNVIVSNLLSFSDGLFGSTSKIVVTTNTHISDIDPALLRSGRCFDFLMLNSLSRDAALKIWCEDLGMTIENFNMKWANKKTVTQSDLMSFYYRITRQKRDREYVLNGPKVYDIDEKVLKLLKTPVGFKT